MPNVCKICTHAKRLQIDRAIVSGQSKASISREFHVSEASLANHAKNHLSRQLLKHDEIRERINSGRILDEVEDLLTRTKRILRDSEIKKQNGMALGAIREIRSTLEFLSKLAITLASIQQQESNAEKDMEDMEVRERIGRLELCELNLLGSIQDKLAGKIPWKRLLPDSFYEEEKNDFMHITLNVPNSTNIEHERIVVRAADDDKKTTCIKTADLVNNFIDVAGEESEPEHPVQHENTRDLEEALTIQDTESIRKVDQILDEPELEQRADEPVKESEPDEPATMTRKRKPLSKIYYGPNMPEALKRRAAKEYVRNHGKMPREKWLRDAL